LAEVSSFIAPQEVDASLAEVTRYYKQREEIQRMYNEVSALEKQAEVDGNIALEKVAGQRRQAIRNAEFNAAQQHSIAMRGIVNERMELFQTTLQGLDFTAPPIKLPDIQAEISRYKEQMSSLASAVMTAHLTLNEGTITGDESLIAVGNAQLDAIDAAIERAKAQHATVLTNIGTGGQFGQELAGVSSFIAPQEVDASLAELQRYNEQILELDKMYLDAETLQRQAQLDGNIALEEVAVERKLSILDAELIAYQEHEKMKTAIARRTAEERARIDAELQGQTLSSMQSVSSILMQGSRNEFEIGKRMSMATTLINT
jgi:hypothetical protein